MKKLTVSLACLGMVALAGSAVAAPPHGKVSILHCGCVIDSAGTVGMAYVEISVSRKAKGHKGHAENTLDTCFDGVDTFTDFVRTGSDCQLGGGSEFLRACDETLTTGTACGVEVTEP